MTLPIVQIGNPVLRQQARVLSAKEIRSPETQKLIREMRETMYKAPGVGLAAPQIGESLQIAVIEDKPEYLQNYTAEQLAERERAPVPFHVIINPKMTIEENEKVAFFEGCLSIEALMGIVPRALAVKVECLNERAEPMVIHARGWYARILQHEIDHLHGHLCIDHTLVRSLMTKENYFQFWHDKSLHEINNALNLQLNPSKNP